VPDTKNGDPLNVPLVPEAVAIFRERKPPKSHRSSGVPVRAVQCD